MRNNFIFNTKLECWKKLLLINGIDDITAHDQQTSMLTQSNTPGTGARG